MSRYIHNLILQGENQHLDFKFEISDAKKIARSFSAFANTDGGTLLIGVKDNGNIAGVRTDEEVYMAESAAKLYCRPPVDFKIVPHRVNEKRILEIIVPESHLKPHYVPWKDNKWKAFVRVNDQNFIADEVLMRVWKLKTGKNKLLVRYDSFEEKLLALLRTKQEITLDDFLVSCKIKPYLAVKILANLISIDIVAYRITESKTYYYLK